MIESSNLEKIDASGMYKIYDRWPEIAEDAFTSEFEKIEFKDVNHIVFAGMGGSGAIGDTFASIFSKTEIHISIVKGYLLPNTTNSKSVVIVTSVSGNTEETLSILNAAKEKKCKIIAVSSGGKIKEFCKKNQIYYIEISKIHSPRSSFVKFTYSLLKILESIIPISKEEVIDSINTMKVLRENISSKNLSDKNSAIKLAKWITDIPLIYYPWGLNAVAIRFKNSLQENSKIHVMIEDVVEVSHNGIVAWENTSNVQPILLQGKDDHIKTKERWEIFKKYFEQNNIEYENIFSVEGNILSKIMNLIYFVDYVSIYKAILTEIDPSPVNSIDFIKNNLNQL